jgi:hypothetical protein
MFNDGGRGGLFMFNDTGKGTGRAWREGEMVERKRGWKRAVRRMKSMERKRE